MLRNHEGKAAQLRDAIGPPRQPTPYEFGGTARRIANMLAATPLEWARSMHAQMRGGELAPRHHPVDAAKIERSVCEQYRTQALEAAKRGENELRVKSVIRALRTLIESPDAGDQKMAADLSKFLRTAWGVSRAAEAVGGKDRDHVAELRELWGDAQLPPEGAMVREVSADWLLVAAVVRRLG